MTEIALSHSGDIALCRLDDLPDPGSAILRLRHGDDRLAQVMVVRRGTKVFAYEDVCPHIPLPLEQLGGKVLASDGRRIYCANHGALFDIESGLCIKGLCEGKSLIPFPVTLKGDVIVRPCE